jgi:hypothetical protein
MIVSRDGMAVNTFCETYNECNTNLIIGFHYLHRDHCTTDQ